MSLRFTGMVAAEAPLTVIERDAGILLETADGKPCLEVERYAE